MTQFCKGDLGGEREEKRGEMQRNAFINLLLKFNTLLFQMINEIDRKVSVVVIPCIFYFNA